MHLWTRLGFRIAIPLTCALYLAALPSPAHALAVPIEAGCHAGLRTFHQQASGILNDIRNYNSERTSAGYKPKSKLADFLNAIAGLQDISSSLEIETAKTTFTDIYKLFKPGVLVAVNTENEKDSPGEVILTGRLQTKNDFTNAINEVCRQEQELTADRKVKVLNYFKSSPFFGGDETITWSLTSKVNAIFSACTNILYLGGTTEAELRFPDSCQTQRNEYQELLTLRKFLDGKTTAHVSTIRDAWQKAGRSSPRTDLATLGDKKPEDILEVPTEAEVAGNETMIALAKAYHQVDFGPWYTHGNFVSDFTSVVTANPLTTAMRDSMRNANFYNDVSPGIKAANAHDMIRFYALRIGDESGVGRNWLDEEKVKNSDFWLWNSAYVFAPKETPKFKPGGDWSFSAEDIRTESDIKFQDALYYMSLRKCVSRREDMRKSTACVEAAKDPTKLPYPFNKVRENTVHPHVTQGESAETITALNAMNYIHRAFACNMRGSQTARSAVYDLKYGWPSTATTRPAHPETVIKFCTNAEKFDEPSTNESTIREVSIKGLPNLFAEASGALRPASGLVAFHELQKVAAAKTPPQELFYMSLNQEKFIPKASDEHQWDAYTKDKSQGLDDLNFRKVISFFGAEMLFMQQGSDIDVIQDIGKLKRKMAETPDALLTGIFLEPETVTTMVTTNKLAGQYLNKVRSNWVSEMVNPLYHAYYSGTGGKTAWETVTFQSQKSALEREDKLVHSAAFKLLMGLDPKHPPIMLNTTTGQVLTFLDWGRPLAGETAEPSEEVVQIPMFLVGDYYKDLPAQGLFPSVGAILGDLSALIPSKNYGLTKSDIFIRKKDKDSDQIDIIPGSAVIGAMQALNMSIAEVIHRECTLQDEGFAQMMGKIRDCKNNPQAVPTPSPAAALAGAAGSPPYPHPLHRIPVCLHPIKLSSTRLAAKNLSLISAKPWPSWLHTTIHNSKKEFQVVVLKSGFRGPNVLTNKAPL